MSDEKWLREALAKGRDEVTDEILNENGQRARKEVQDALRKGSKSRVFKRKNKRRRRK